MDGDKVDWGVYNGGMMNDQTKIQITPHLGFEVITQHGSYLEVMRIDPEQDDDVCEHDEMNPCNATIEFQVSIADAPELRENPDCYLLCRGHADEVIGRAMLVLIN